jgi:hypothetical protein
MGTRSRIGIEMPDHTIVSVYCHWDGYPEYNGKILVEHYQNREDVQELIDGGGISSLRTRRNGWGIFNPLTDENGHYISDAEGFMMYENDREPQPLYYSERGEDEPPTMTSFYEFVSGDCGEEFAYLYDLNGNWKAWKLGWGETNTQRVEIPNYVTA